tara:strand:+ start:7436 stop:8479 length:1044 start_codon:yes stop_codon:yes gene_type:complete
MADIEIIIVNDGSTDSSATEIHKYLVDSRLTYIELEHNVGTFHARLKGWQACRGDYIGTVDSDDWVEPDFIETLYNLAVQHDADVAECGLIGVTENGRTEVIPWADHNHRFVSDDEILKLVLERGIWHIAANKLFRSSLFSASEWFYQRVFEKIVVADDKLLTFPLFASSRSFVSTKQRLYCYRLRSESTTHNRVVEHDLRHIEDSFNVDKYISEYLGEMGLLSQYGDTHEMNVRQEILLSLRNISCYEPGSHNRRRLYAKIVERYKDRVLLALHENVLASVDSGRYVLGLESELQVLRKHVVGAENSFHAVLKNHYPYAYFLYRPLYFMMKKVERLVFSFKKVKDW